MRPDQLPEDLEIDEVLRRLDHPVPQVLVDSIIRTARRPKSSRLRWAAGVALLLAVAAGAAYAAPGSPVRAWIAEVGRALGFGSEPGSSEPTEGAVPTPESAGIALIPGNELTIEFVEAGLAGTLRVDFTDDAEVVVSAPTGATRFVSEPERLLVEHTTPDTVRVSIPRAGARNGGLVTIRVGTRELLRVIDGSVSAVMPPAGGGGYVLPLGDAPR